MSFFVENWIRVSKLGWETWHTVKFGLKDMEKSTKSEFQTEIKPKTEEKKEDFEEHVQHGMEIVEKFLNESETQLQEFRDPL